MVALETLKLEQSTVLIDCCKLNQCTVEMLELVALDYSLNTLKIA